jgi:hypothetical protein
MADRYDDYERNSQSRRGERRDDREGYDRGGDFGREESDYRFRNREHEQDQYGRGQMGRDRYGDQSYGGMGRERYNDRSYSNQYGNQSANQYGNQGRENYGQPSWGEQRSGQHDWDPRRPDWQRTRYEWGRERTGNEGPWGTGSQGFGTGYRSAEFSSSGGYTGFGLSGSESYYGGAGAYGQQQQRGRFTGKGPKGYQRSDDRIREDVCERLTHHSDIDASEIEVKVTNAEVTLSGTVDERSAKRMAEEIVESISGVKDVHNQVRVRDQNSSTQQQGKSESSAKELTGSQRR